MIERSMSLPCLLPHCLVPVTADPRWEVREFENAAPARESRQRYQRWHALCSSPLVEHAEDNVMRTQNFKDALADNAEEFGVSGDLLHCVVCDRPLGIRRVDEVKGIIIRCPRCNALQHRHRGRRH